MHNPDSSATRSSSSGPECAIGLDIGLCADGIGLSRILHQAAYRVLEICLFFLNFSYFFGVCLAYKPRWPRPRLSFARMRAHAPSTIGGAMLPVASTRIRAKSGAIIATLGAICGLSNGCFRSMPTLVPHRARRICRRRERQANVLLPGTARGQAAPSPKGGLGTRAERVVNAPVDLGHRTRAMATESCDAHRRDRRLPLNAHPPGRFPRLRHVPRNRAARCSSNVTTHPLSSDIHKNA